METEHIQNISVSEEIKEKSENIQRSLNSFQKKLSERDDRILELEKELSELKSKRVHYDENKILAEFEIRLIKVESYVQDLHSKLFQPSVENKNIPVLTNYGKQIKKRFRV